MSSALPNARSGRMAGLPAALRGDTISSVVLLLAVSALVLLPLGFLLYATLSTGSPGERGAEFTLANLHTVYLTDKYHGALFNTLMLGAVVTVIAMPIGTAFAWFVA